MSDRVSDDIANYIYSIFLASDDVAMLRRIVNAEFEKRPTDWKLFDRMERGLIDRHDNWRQDVKTIYRMLQTKKRFLRPPHMWCHPQA
jgi:hypothetical protein